LEHQDSLVNAASGLNRIDTFKTANDNEDAFGLNKQDTFKTCVGDNNQLISQKIMIDTTGGANRRSMIEENTQVQVAANLHIEEEKKEEEEDAVEEYEKRVQLPILRDPNDRPSIWKILKSAVYMNEPLSMIQKVVEIMEYEDLLVKAN
jgi:hypothetical protein